MTFREIGVSKRSLAVAVGTVEMADVRAAAAGKSRAAEAEPVKLRFFV